MVAHLRVNEPPSSLRVAIAGLGPKGLFALERLLEHAGLDADLRIDVDLFEPHPHPGSGPVYDPGQPDYLRMNLPASQVDMWWPAGGAVPRRERASFLEWSGTSDGDAYPPRADVGRYLAEGFETLWQHAPPNVGLQLLPAGVEAMRRSGDAWSVDAGGASHAYDEVLIAIGHGSTAFPFAQLSRERVAPGAIVAIRGFALTFIDAALALTEGRGGRFEPHTRPHRLRYLPGPDDPGLIIPFTRSGRPMLAKPHSGVAAGIPSLGRIAAEGRARLDDIGGTVDLHGDLLPILARSAGSSVIAAAGDDVGGSLQAAAERWLAKAAGGIADAGEPDVVSAIERSLLVGAGLATPDLPWALGHTWRALYPAIVARLSGDGLSPSDWPAFLRLAREFERVAFGPPALNAAKLLALIEAGTIDLGYLRGGTLAGNGTKPALQSALGTRSVDVALDAVLPEPGASAGASLLAGLIASGDARVPVDRRGLEVTGNGSCRGRDGTVTPGLSAIGRPTEDSVIGNDTLSRALHPQGDRWARRIVQRARDRQLAAARRRRTQAAPA